MPGLTTRAFEQLPEPMETAYQGMNQIVWEALGVMRTAVTTNIMTASMAWRTTLDVANYHFASDARHNRKQVGTHMSLRH